jgi:ADP-heptose:LPS heptosyltransferase
MPHAKLVLTGKEKQYPLLRTLAGSVVDEVLTLGIDGGVSRIRRSLKEAGVTTLVDLAGNDKSGLLSSFSSAKRFRPAPKDCKGICALYTPFARSMARSRPDVHRVDQLMDWICTLGEIKKEYSFRMYPCDEAVALVEQIIDRHQLRSGKVIVLNVGASRNTKRWPAENFRKLAEQLVSAGYRTVIMGARNFRYDRDYDAKVSADFFDDGFVDGEHCINLIEEGGLESDIHLQRDTQFLRYSGIPKVVVGCDTGPMQIAGSVGTDAQVKSISLFGPTNWNRYAPYDPSRTYPDNPRGDYGRVITATGLDCMPKGNQEACAKYRRGCQTCECMKSICPEGVLEAIVEHAGL